MKAQHTRGPWTKSDRLNGPFWHISSGHTVGGEICKSGRQAVAAVYGESKRGAIAYAEMFEANACLIAAAPDLLTACETVVACIEQGVAVDREALNGLAMSRLLAAISKATRSAA